METPFVGAIAFYPYNFAPKGWITCQGQILPIQQNVALFSLIGTFYGGNGTSTFALPDLQGRTTVSQGQAQSGTPYELGEIGGVEGVSLTIAEMGPHAHQLNATATQGTVDDPTGALLASPFTGTRGNESTGQPYNVPAAQPTTIIIAPNSIANSGNGAPHNNIQPSLVLTPCIAIAGVFPARN